MVELKWHIEPLEERWRKIKGRRQGKRSGKMTDPDPLIISLHISDLNMQINRQRSSDLINKDYLTTFYF